MCSLVYSLRSAQLNMASKIIPDDRTIYSTFSNIFKGANASMRKQKSVKKLVQQHETKPEVRQLLKRYGSTELADRLRVLLTEGIFESTPSARKRFPAFFEPSPAQSPERAASEVATAPQQAQTLEQAVEEALDDEAGSCGVVNGTENEELPLDSPVSKPPDQVIAPAGTENPASALQAPSLFPMYLPFATDHRILVKTQSVLESACFRFASETIPDVCAQRGWDCAEAAELNVIALQLLKSKTSLRRLEAAAGGQALDMLVQSIVRLRHATVHRERLTIKDLEQFLIDAEAFATKLDDNEAVSVLSRSRRGVQKSIMEMQNKKVVLETRLRDTLDDIAAQRAELDRLEKAAVADVLRADAEYQSFIGTRLEERLEKTDDESDAGGSSDDGPGLSDGSASGIGNDTGYVRDGCETEGEDECFEDAQEHDTGFSLALLENHCDEDRQEHETGLFLAVDIPFDEDQCVYSV